MQIDQLQYVEDVTAITKAIVPLKDGENFFPSGKSHLYVIAEKVKWTEKWTIPPLNLTKKEQDFRVLFQMPDSYTRLFVIVRYNFLLDKILVLSKVECPPCSVKEIEFLSEVLTVAASLVKEANKAIGKELQNEN